MHVYGLQLPVYSNIFYEKVGMQELTLEVSWEQKKVCQMKLIYGKKKFTENSYFLSFYTVQYFRVQVVIQFHFVAA